MVLVPFCSLMNDPPLGRRLLKLTAWFSCCKRPRAIVASIWCLQSTELSTPLTSPSGAAALATYLHRAVAADANGSGLLENAEWQYLEGSIIKNGVPKTAFGALRLGQRGIKIPSSHPVFARFHVATIQGALE